MSTTPPPPQTKHTVLVVHADTYTGHYIARHLVMDPTLHVRITARRRESVEELERLGCELHILRDFPPNPHDLDAVYAKVQSVVLVPPMVRDLDKIVQAHMDACKRTGEPSPRSTLTQFDTKAMAITNATGETNDGVGHLVFMSAIRADRGYPTTDLWTALDKAETRVRGFTRLGGSPASTILRIGYVQQNLVTLAELIRARAVLPLPIGHEAKVAPVNLKDIASAVRSVVHGGRRAGEAEGKTFKLTGPQALTGERMATLASGQLGFEIVFVDIKDKDMRQILGTVAGSTEEEVDAMMATFKDVRDGYHDTVSEDLEYLLPRPPQSLARFFRENVNQFRPEMLKQWQQQQKAMPITPLVGDPLLKVMLSRRRNSMQRWGPHQAL
ncbi:hypothetical protein BCR44DRAFT_1433857 [Catenaria anguillulae PL171]|uniref:NmrA-like domain-containing protein n=1 Tax=Catenaria anguillulae PL171 TaxID=765915 RepID=A0A1Y2HPJ5_9FUNG|nr:hypothetical protein BCR44DRAFT_1433857 [Catenaria anguillulae PL171]